MGWSGGCSATPPGANKPNCLCCVAIRLQVYGRLQLFTFIGHVRSGARIAAMGCDAIA